MQNVELTLAIPALAPRLHPSPLRIHLHDTRVVVAVRDERIAGVVPGNVRRTIERSPPRPRLRTGRWLGCRRFDRFGAPPKRQENFTGGTELDDHVRAFVDRPDVAACVDAHRVRESESIEVLADLANERAVRSELEQLCSGRAVERAAHTSAA